MKRIEFKTGEKVSGTYWTVIEEVPSKNGERYYKCRCICGKVKEVNVKNLKYGKSKYIRRLLGYFKTLEEAATARKQAEEELYKPILEKYNYKLNKEN